MEKFIELTLSGIAIGSVYALVALGFVLVFKATDVLNFAHGEFMMLAVFLSLTLLVSWGLNFIVSGIVIAVLMAVLGLVIFFLVMKPLVGQPLFSVVLVTIGIAIILRAVVLITYGPVERGRINVLPQGRFDIGDISVSYIGMILFGVSAISVLAFLWFFNRTRTGLRLKAVAENLEAASAMGISAVAAFAISWGIGALMAGVAGTLYSNFTPVIDTNLSAIGLRAFPAAVLGGLNSIGGAIVGGLIVGIVEQLAAGYLGGEWRDVVAFGLMFVVIIVRPYGLFGTPELIRV